MAKGVLCALLVFVGAGGLAVYHRWLTMSGGPDTNRLLGEGILPYALGLLLVVVGLALGLGAYRDWRRRT